MNSNAQAIAFLALVRSMAANCLQNLAGMQKLAALWSNEQIANVIPNDSNVIQDANALQPVTDAAVQTSISDFNTLITAFTTTIQTRMSLLATAKIIPPI